MFDPSFVTRTFAEVGFTHVVWIPDSFLGPWEAALESTPELRLVRPTREGEALALAGGLLLGGAKPLVICQCTGLFEAGDALRNIVHDLQLPLKLLVGVRSYRAFLAGKSNDNCPLFAVPFLEAWRVPFTILPNSELEPFRFALRGLAAAQAAQAVLLGE